MRTLLFYFLVAFVPLYSCQENMQDFPDAPLESSSNRRISTGEALFKPSHGWLEFKSLEAFNTTMKMLHDKYTPDRLKDWESTLKGFKSLRSLYEAIDADESPNRRVPTVDSLINSNQLLYCPDSHFSTVLSKDGYIQIADTVYSFRPGVKNGEAYAIPARYVEALIQGKNPKEMQGTQIHPTSFQLFPVPRWRDWDWTIVPVQKNICDFPDSPMPNWWGQKGGYLYGGNNNQTFPEHNGRTVRLRYERWRVGYIFYASAGIRLKMEKHTRFAGWRSITNAEEMVMEACIKGNLVEPTGATPFQTTTSPAWPGFKKTGTNKFEKTLKWVGNGVFAEILLDHFNFHFSVNYRGRIAERFIRE